VAGSRSRRKSDELAEGDVTAPEAGGKAGWHAYLVAGARGCLDAEGATGLLGDGDLCHVVHHRHGRAWLRLMLDTSPRGWSASYAAMAGSAFMYLQISDFRRIISSRNVRRGSTLS
jgi:hypothetical protein